MFPPPKKAFNFISAKRSSLEPLFLILFFLIFPKAVLASGIIINEIMYDLKGTDEKHEWIELYNNSSTQIDLTGWKINDGDDATNHELNAPPKNNSRGSLIITPNGYLLLAADAATLALDLPNYQDSIIDTVLELPNTGATLKLLDKEKNEIASAIYLKTMGANGNGKTIEWTGSVFTESLSDGGTPGTANVFLPTPSLPSPSPSPTSSSPEETPVSLSPEPTPANPYQYSKDVLITEFLPAPTAEQTEWIEIFNGGTETIDLSGWQIADSQLNKRQLPENSLLEANDYLVVTLKGSLLNNDGDSVQLLWPDDQIIHSVSYQKAPSGFSCARFDGGRWLWTNQLTPGQANKKSFTETPPTPTTQEAVAIIETATAPPQPPKIPSPSSFEKIQMETPIETPIINNAPLAAIASPKNYYSGKTYFYLFIVTTIALLAALFLISFRRKTNSPIDDPETNP
jgi:hypothetical protein